MFSSLQKQDPAIYDLIMAEQERQTHGMELIASENYQSQAVLSAQASVFANKYSEGYPGRRYYGGQENTDLLEQLAIDRAKALFGSDHANVQGLSGAAANIAIYGGLLDVGDTILGMDLSHGGHLTHGSPVTFMSRVFNFVNYGTVGGLIDYDDLVAKARKHKPKIILAGFSAYPRELDYARFLEIANEVGAIAMADMSHIGGLIAGKALKNPLSDGFHVMMTTTHKSLRGPRGALILTKGTVSNPLKKPEHTIENIPTIIDRAVFPGTQGGPHMNSIAGVAVALHEASQDSFKVYAAQVIQNAKAMAEEFVRLGYNVVTGGTDNHMIIIDFSKHTLGNGSVAEKTLDKIGISTSKSQVPNDPNPPFRPSGLRLGIQAMTTRGVIEDDVREIVGLMHDAFKNHNDDNTLSVLKQEIQTLCQKFPLPR